jgi:adenine phosphoribosyltransferase
MIKFYLFFSFAFVNFALANLPQTQNSTWILDYTRTIADFPKAGIQFKWFAPLLRDPQAFSRAINEFADRYRNSTIEVIAGLDSRGFIFGAALAYELKLPFILIRKPGKLPGNVERIDYELEYGRNTFEIEKDSLQQGQKVLIIDDIFATGGTAAAACSLVERLGAEVVEVACLIELPVLEGRKRVAHPVFSLVSIEN